MRTMRQQNHKKNSKRKFCVTITKKRYCFIVAILSIHKKAELRSCKMLGSSTIQIESSILFTVENSLYTVPRNN